SSLRNKPTAISPMKTENLQQSYANRESESSGLAPSPRPPRRVHRRAFLRGIGAGAALLAPGAATLFAKNPHDHFDNGKLSKGDAALLRFAAAAEILE